MARAFMTCSWCHESNERRKGDQRKVYCWSCGHRADVPRAECDCRKCRNKTLEDCHLQVDPPILSELKEKK